MTLNEMASLYEVIGRCRELTEIHLALQDLQLLDLSSLNTETFHAEIISIIFTQISDYLKVL